MASASSLSSVTSGHACLPVFNSLNWLFFPHANSVESGCQLSRAPRVLRRPRYSWDPSTGLQRTPQTSLEQSHDGSFPGHARDRHSTMQIMNIGWPGMGRCPTGVPQYIIGPWLNNLGEDCPTRAQESKGLFDRGSIFSEIVRPGFNNLGDCPTGVQQSGGLFGRVSIIWRIVRPGLNNLGDNSTGVQ